MRDLLVLVMLTGVVGCGPIHTRVTPAEDLQKISSLWVDSRIGTRDLFGGAGGARIAPPVRGGRFAFVERKSAGTNPGYEVQDERGRKWSVKLGKEAQTEVVASRILWAVGYHQPATYYVAEWSMTGAVAGRQEPARFRLESDGEDVASEWSWYENPFVGTQAFRGLVVLQLILNNWDLKTVNNKVYISDRGPGSERYVVRDLGASLGGARQFPLLQWLNIRQMQGTRNDLEAFESMEFIAGVDGDRVRFAYRGLDEPLIDTVRRDDVVWTCRRLQQITDRQWRDAFRAGGYTPEQARRYIAKIKAKVHEGLALESRPSKTARVDP